MNYLHSFLESFQRNKISSEWLQSNNQQIKNAKKNIILSFSNYSSLNNSLKRFYDSLLHKKLFKDLFTNQEIFNFLYDREVLKNRYAVFFLLSIIEFEENVLEKIESISGLTPSDYASAIINNDNFSIEIKQELNKSKLKKNPFLFLNLNYETLLNVDLILSDIVDSLKNKTIKQNELNEIFIYLLNKFPESKGLIINEYLSNDLCENLEELKNEMQLIYDINIDLDNDYVYNKYLLRFGKIEPIHNKLKEEKLILLFKNISSLNNEYSNELINYFVNDLEQCYRYHLLSNKKTIINKTLINHFTDEIIKNIFEPGKDYLYNINGLFGKFEISKKYIYKIIDYIHDNYQDGMYINNIVNLLNDFKSLYFEFDFDMFYKYIEINKRISNLMMLQFFEFICVCSEDEKFKLLDMLLSIFDDKDTLGGNYKLYSGYINKLLEMVLDNDIIDKLYSKHKSNHLFDFFSYKYGTLNVIETKYGKTYYKFIINYILDEDYTFNTDISVESIIHLLNSKNAYELPNQFIFKTNNKISQRAVFLNLNENIVNEHAFYFVRNIGLQKEFVPLLIDIGLYKTIKSNDDYEEMINEYTNDLLLLQNINNYQIIEILNFKENKKQINKKNNFIIKANNNELSYEDIDGISNEFLFLLLKLNIKIKYAYEILKNKDININLYFDSFSIINQEALRGLIKISEDKYNIVDFEF